MEKGFVWKTVSWSLVICKCHQENVETEIEPYAHGEDDDDGGHGAELDAEQLANNAGSDEAEKEKK